MAIKIVSFVYFASLLCVKGNFLGKLDNSTRPHGHAIDAYDVARSLNASIESVMGEHSEEDGQRVALIEKSIWRTFQALQKNEAGRLAPRSVRYIAHNYFAKEHGWQLSGFEPESMQSNASELHSASIMQERAPALVEAMLEARENGRGLTFEDVVVMISALERLIFQESVSLLHSAYALNGLSTTEAIDERELHEVLQSYLLLYRQGFRASLEDYHRHQEDKLRLAQFGGDWLELVAFEQDMAWNKAFSTRDTTNPFKARAYKFEETADIVNALAHNYGKWQNRDCVAMKEHLMTLNSRGTGRVTLKRFYEPTEKSAYQFHESLDYLRSIGALDESNGSPQVRIANYVAGPTNCIAQSAYYSVCCLSECEALMNELEGKVQSPKASPEQLFRLVSDLDSDTVEAPRQLAPALTTKLRDIGDRHDGAVPLHGRLFAQWMHFAFPNECPFPDKVAAAALTPSQWLDGKAIADGQEVEKHRDNEVASDSEVRDVHMAQWSDDEILPLHDSAPGGGRFAGVRFWLDWSFRLLPVLVVLRLAYNSWQSAVRAHSGTLDSKDKLGHMI